MATELIVNASLPETRIALMEEGEIQELLIERDTGKGIVGNIYKGRVTRVLPGMQAAFIDIGLEKAAFLYVDDVFVHSSIWSEEEGESDEANPDYADLADPGSENTPVRSPVIIPNNVPALDSHERSDVSDSTGLEPSEDARLDDSEHSAEDSDADMDEDGDSEIDDEEGIEEATAQLEASLQEDARRLADNTEPSEAATPAETAGESVSVEIQVTAPTENEEGQVEAPASADSNSETPGSIRFERGKKKPLKGPRRVFKGKKKGPTLESIEAMPESFHQQVSEEGDVVSDRASVSGEMLPETASADRTSSAPREKARIAILPHKSQRSKDRRLPPRSMAKGSRASVNIQDLLKEGQEVIVQVSKDPIATKGARLTCHLSLPGRHLVCMPTIDHVGVSRRIERDDERRRLREFVESNRPKKLGFIVRTATAGGKQSSERRIAQDIDYLSKLWGEIKEKAGEVQAPAMIYEDLTPVLRAIRDWVNEDIDKIVVDARYPFNQVQKFVKDFMPDVYDKVELYQGDLPVFDAYNISAELARALERKVWLKSGGYLVIDQAEALVAIDVNTGRFVGKRSLEETILKTNLEAVKEIAYQLRLRNCGGIIILDLIDMDREDHKFRVYRALEEEIRKDRARPQILKISELGLVEMTRKRTRDTMVRSLCEPCSHCEGKGFMKSKQTVAYEVLRDLERSGIDRESQKILIQAHADVIDTLAIDERETLDQLERRYRKSIFLQAVAGYHPEQFEVMTEKQMKSQSEKSDEKIFEKARESVSRAEGKEGRSRGRGGSGGDRFRGSNDRGATGERGGQDRFAKDRPAIIQPKRVVGAPGVITPLIRPIKPRDPSVVPAGQTDTQREDGSGESIQFGENESTSNFQNEATLGVTAGDGLEDGSDRTGINPSAERAVRGANDPVSDDDFGNRVDSRGGRGNNNNRNRRGGRGHPQSHSPSDEDEDSFGNRIGYQPNRETPAGAGAGSSGPDEDDFSEEDRRAYLRAQAAQDAALSKLGASGMSMGAGSPGGQGRRDRSGGRWGQQGGRNDRSGGRSGGFGGGGSGRFQSRNGGGGGQGRSGGFQKNSNGGQRFQGPGGGRGRPGPNPVSGPREDGVSAPSVIQVQTPTTVSTNSSGDGSSGQDL